MFGTKVCIVPGRITQNNTLPNFLNICVEEGKLATLHAMFPAQVSVMTLKSACYF